jgi:anti-sigma factor RsiW
VARPADHERLTLYAVDALSRRDRRAVESHLAHCPRCRLRLVELGESGAALERECEALERGAVDPPEALLAQILERAESPPQESRRAARRLVAAGGFATALAACSLALWASGDGVGGARAYDLHGADGLLTVASNGHAVLLVKGLKPAPRGREYKAWLVHRGHTSLAGVFAGGSSPSIVPLTRRLPAGAVVAVSLETATSSSLPRGRLLFAAAAP